MQKHENKGITTWLRNINSNGIFVKGGQSFRDDGAVRNKFDGMMSFLYSESEIELKHIDVGRFLKYFCYIIKMIQVFGCGFDKIEHIEVSYESWLYVRLASFRLPAIEHKMRRFIMNAFPKTSGRIPSKLNVNIDDIRKEDSSVVSTYVASKESLTDFKFLKVKVFFQAIESVIIAFGLEKGIQHKWKRSDSINSILASLPTDTSSGFPFFKKKGDPTVVEDTVRFFDKFLNHLNFKNRIIELYSNPVVIFHRFTTKLKDVSFSQVWKASVKIRQVFGTSFRVVFLESYVFNSVQQSIIKYGTQHAIGCTRLRISNIVSAFRSNMHHTSRVVVCGDISGIDRNVTCFQIITFFSVFMMLCPHGALIDILATLAIWHCYTPIITSEGLYITGGGNVSGSKITMLLNTFLVSLAAHYFYILCYGRAPKSDEFNNVGDDFILVIDHQDYELLIRVFTSFNLTLNRDKTHICNNPASFITYLGLNWNRYNEPDNPDLWWISRTVFPERFVEERTTFFNRTFVRFCSIIFQLKRGHDIYDRFFQGNPILSDRLRKHIQLEGEPIIEFIDKRGRTQFGKVPLQILLERGWLCY